MKKLIILPALVTALCLALVSGAFADGGFARVDGTHWAGESVTIESVEIADAYAGYVDATQFGNVSRILYDGGVIDVDNDRYTAILTGNGIQADLYNVRGRTFEGDIAITLVEKDAVTNQGNSRFGDDAGSLIGPFAYAAAAYFGADGYAAASSVAAAQNGAAITDTSVAGMEYISIGDYMTGVFANAGEVTISDSTFYASGRGGDDYTGQGASVVAAGDARVTIERCAFDSYGALRSAIRAGDRASVAVTDTVVQAYNDDLLVPYTTDDNYAVPMLQQAPFALGLTGNIRATLDCGQAFIAFTDCLIASEGWAVLSTDSGSGAMTATDTTALIGTIEHAELGGDYEDVVTINGVGYGIRPGRAGEMSGCVAFCDGFTDRVYGGRWYAPDYLCVITGGSVEIAASESGRFYGWSDRVGFMSCQTASSTALTISEADFDVADTFLTVKSKGGNGETITLTDVTVSLTGGHVWGGNLLTVIDSDDLGGGPGGTTFTVPYGDYDAYLTAPNGGAGGVTTLNVNDCLLVGSVYDSVGSQTGSQTAFKTDGVAVVLNDSYLAGAVSSAYGVHCDADGSVLTGDFTVDSYGREGTYDHLAIGRVRPYAAPTVNNDVTLTLNGSWWTCTGLSYLASLTVDDESTVNGDVYGADGGIIELAAGTYENVVVVPAGEDLAGTIAAAEAAIAADAAGGVTPLSGVGKS